MTYEEAMQLAEETFAEQGYNTGEYCHKQSFLWGFQEAYDILTALYKKNFETVKKMREAQKEQRFIDSTLERDAMYECRKVTRQLEIEVDELISKI